jgi:hypothetical protein
VDALTDERLLRLRTSAHSGALRSALFPTDGIRLNFWITAKPRSPAVRHFLLDFKNVVFHGPELYELAHSSENERVNTWARCATCLLMLIVSAAKLFAGGSGLNVVVVVNQNSPNSVELGNYYCEKPAAAAERFAHPLTGGNGLDAPEFETTARAAQRHAGCPAIDQSN